MDKRDIVEQLQDACDLAMNPLKLERLCGNAKIEIERLRSAIASSGTSALNDGLGAEMPDKESDTNRTGFRAELETLINSHSKENGSDTPDFILADYMADCLDAYDRAVTRRMEWYRPALKDTPNDRVEGRDAALSRRVPSHDGLAGSGSTE